MVAALRRLAPSGVDPGQLGMPEPTYAVVTAVDAQNDDPFNHDIREQT
jgi:hypothetical protein